MGTEFEATIYLPEDMLLTRDRRNKADTLDDILKAKIDSVNKEYATLSDNVKKNEIAKWRWLGQKLDNIIKSSPIEQVDIDNNLIWPALGQYLRTELSRGLDDKKRSGTKYDHYRKCWALYAIPGTTWITSWVGWDAFTDRGEQLVYTKRLMPMLENKFSKLKTNLNSEDLKEIAKLAVKYIPSQAKTPADLASMPDEKLEAIATSVYRDFRKYKKDSAGS